MLNQRLEQKQQQKLSPLQIQVIKMLEIPTIELEQRIKAEIEENPALELGSDDDDTEDKKEENDNENNEDENENEENDDEFSIDDYINEDDYPDYKTQMNNRSPDQEDKEIPFSVGYTFREHLVNQIGMRNFTDKEKILAEYIIGNIDEDGYLSRTLENIVDDIAFNLNVNTNEKELEKVLVEIQDFDPPGIAARNLQECLILQIKRKDLKNKDINTSYIILKDFFTEFTRKHYEKIQQKMNISEIELKSAFSEIIKLNPKPGSSYNDPLNKSGQQFIIPDFILEEDNSKLILSLHSRNLPELKISRVYNEMLRQYKDSSVKTQQQKEAVSFVKQKIDMAKWFIDAIRQRYNTLQSTMQAIIDFQYDYFISGDETKLKPMILKDIAEKTNLDISTISRVANSKYIQTPFGIISLKFFFSEGLMTDSGEEASSREIKKILQNVIENENKKHPFTDEKLSKILNEKGYQIARRTIAKYREQLNIPVGRLRKELK